MTSSPSPPDRPLHPARLFGLAALAALMVGCLLILRPFLSSLLWAGILAFCTWPAFRTLRDRLRLSPTLAALVMVALEMLLVGLPILLATPIRADDVQGLRASAESLIADGLPGLGDKLGGIPWIGAYLQQWSASLQLDFSPVTNFLRPYAGVIAQQALGVLLAILSGLAELVLAILLSFFFYRDGPRMAAGAEAVVSRIAGPQARRLMQLIANVTLGVVYGLLGTALAQGLLTGFGLWIAGVPQPVLLSVIAGVISVLPVGAPLVWLPAALWLLSQGSVGWGIFLLLYGAFGISSVDNVIRPWLISRGADLPLLLTILGALGGVLAFGFLGLFLGPVLLAVGFTLLRDWAEEEPQTLR
ncbi:AI-2E family transporter [Teichococcus vastitatis]|jgi:predicted PurR-regulated permease PerM|uniref:AI-2E family transporter n=1 Tax=Teichococcus vastitatis TaxID=2307076 RepID=A0ABS9W3U5_9PROT|nr:AI-2E family transporter [Pseudoroseomonas vastitatis]MCI0753540.1 AI-2E family transporter [Pseudoroseomonas vastitatis]